MQGGRGVNCLSMYRTSLARAQECIIIIFGNSYTIPLGIFQRQNGASEPQAKTVHDLHREVNGDQTIPK